MTKERRGIVSFKKTWAKLLKDFSELGKNLTSTLAESIRFIVSYFGLPKTKRKGRLNHGNCNPDERDY
jgi:hypothetical protein